MAGRLNQVQNQAAWDAVQERAKTNAARAISKGGRREQLTHLERGYYDAMRKK